MGIRSLFACLFCVCASSGASSTVASELIIKDKQFLNNEQRNHVVSLMKNRIVDPQQPHTMVIAWLLEEENKNCFEGHKHIDEKSIYCIELDHSKKPHRCVITAAKTLNHFTLGEAVQRCYYLSASLTQK